MNYELAKKLKDAGFPNYTEGVIDGKTGKIITDIWMPTLSELIGACGKSFDFLANNRNRTWQASGGSVQDTTGTTPEEAVANLWLALNEKKQNE